MKVLPHGEQVFGASEGGEIGKRRKNKEEHTFPCATTITENP